jgi:hypothetical protein
MIFQAYKKNRVTRVVYVFIFTSILPILKNLQNWLMPHSAAERSTYHKRLDFINSKLTCL